MGLSIHNTYNEYKKEFNLVDNFYEITVASYSICAMMSEQPQEFDIKKFKEKILLEEGVSYTPGDIEVGSGELICEWIDIDEYAKRYELNLEIVQRQVLEGQCGAVQEKEGKKYIIWPKEHQNDTDLPSLEKKKFSVRIIRKQSVDIGVNNHDELLGYMQKNFHDIVNATIGARITLNRETFLLYWTAFEQYIAQMAFVLFEIYPEEVFKNKKYNKDTMNYLTIFEQSKQLTDIVELRQYILNNIIYNANTGNKDSISRTIQFIKDCFLGKEIDPYKTYYVYKSERIEVDFSVLDEVRMVRNALVHERGKMSPGLNDITIISKVDKGYIEVDDVLLSKANLTLKAIGYNLYNCLKKTKRDLI